MTDVAFDSAHRKGYQKKLSVVHSKGGRCNFWGLLHCDDRRSPWWASRDGSQHDRSCSDTFMICMNFNNYASFVTFFIIPVLFCSVLYLNTKLYMLYECLLCLMFITVSLQSKRVWKPLKLGLSISFSLAPFCLCSRYNNVNYGAWHVCKTLFGSSFATFRLACSEISLSINEKKQERSLENRRT